MTQYLNKKTILTITVVFVGWLFFSDYIGACIHAPKHHSLIAFILYHLPMLAFSAFTLLLILEMLLNPIRVRMLTWALFRSFHPWKGYAVLIVGLIPVLFFTVVFLFGAFV